MMDSFMLCESGKDVDFLLSKLERGLILIILFLRHCNFLCLIVLVCTLNYFRFSGWIHGTIILVCDSLWFVFSMYTIFD